MLRFISDADRERRTFRNGRRFVDGSSRLFRRLPRRLNRRLRARLCANRTHSRGIRSGDRPLNQDRSCHTDQRAPDPYVDDPPPEARDNAVPPFQDFATGVTGSPIQPSRCWSRSSLAVQIESRPQAG